MLLDENNCLDVSALEGIVVADVEHDHHGGGSPRLKAFSFLRNRRLKVMGFGFDVSDRFGT